MRGCIESEAICDLTKVFGDWGKANSNVPIMSGQEAAGFQSKQIVELKRLEMSLEDGTIRRAVSKKKASHGGGGGCDRDSGMERRIKYLFTSS